jgi:hypothetical protein
MDGREAEQVLGVGVGRDDAWLGAVRVGEAGPYAELRVPFVIVPFVFCPFDSRYGSLVSTLRFKHAGETRH